uniref:Uncharacterized protein n=1 Tax=Ditylenchus dipsaci TaxID=166011 RepID=A0A915EK97_9BILA
MFPTEPSSTAFSTSHKSFSQFLQPWTYSCYTNPEEEYPIYPPLTWNCFQSVLDGSARTNNAQEGWHMRFNKKFSKRNTSLSHYIVRMKEEDISHGRWLSGHIL